MKINSTATQSFGSLYVLPSIYFEHEDCRKDFITQTKDMIKPEEKESFKYNIAERVYYVNIQDKYDKAFEDCAAIYGKNGVMVRKAKNSYCKGYNDDDIKVNIKTPAQKDLDYLIQQIALGDEYSTKDNKNGTKSIIINGFNRKDEYIIDVNPNNHKLIKKVRYYLGKPDEIIEYDNEGFYNYKTTDDIDYHKLLGFD